MANVAIYADLNLFLPTLCLLIKEEEPPRLEAVLRMTEAKLKSQPELMNFQELASALCKQFDSQIAEVRKMVVLCLVEVRMEIGN